MTSHMVTITGELLAANRAEADSHGDQHRYNAAIKLATMYKKILDCDERPGEHGNTILTLSRAVLEEVTV